MTPAPLWCIALYEAALLACVPIVRCGGGTFAVTLMLVATSFVIRPPHVSAPLLRITVLDVGQADAIAIETPGHHAILVDAGGRLERGPQGDDSVAERIGERIVVPFLIREGIHHVDAVIISHPHGDHVGGCSPVLRRLRVAEIADSGQTYGGHAYHDCLDTAHTGGVPIVYPRAGTVWQTNDGVTLRFIGPSMPFIGGRNAINDNSIAFILQYGSFRMLFTGDAGSAAEQRFLAEGIDLHADVLKVGHHGSAYGSSPEFIAAVHPHYAIVSVGRHNMFGHPAPSTVETLQRIGATVYRTDENGAATITTDGKHQAVIVTSEKRADGRPRGVVMASQSKQVLAAQRDLSRESKRTGPSLGSPLRRRDSRSAAIVHRARLRPRAVRAPRRLQMRLLAHAQVRVALSGRLPLRCAGKVVRCLE
jgi:competence protein ComEC